MIDNNKHMPLSVLVTQKTARNTDNPFLYNPYGPDTGGQFINHWISNFSRISFFTRSFGVSDFSTQSMIDVYVPVTATGIAPDTIGEQPYSWDGKINCSAADSAVWHAFGLLTDNEARDFMMKNAPVVVFQYIERSRPCRLTVQYIDREWVVTDSED